MATAPYRHRRVSRRALLAVLLTACGSAVHGAASTFDTGPELGKRLLQNVVRIAALDLGEHGFGLVVGVDQESAYIVTARHVVARRAPAGLVEPERVSGEISIRFCAAATTAPPQAAVLLTAFAGVDDDLALLRTPRPRDYAPLAAALAPAGHDSSGEAAWQLGREGECALVPTPGIVSGPPDERNNLRIDLHGALGGSSGVPVASGYGILGLTKRSDSETIRGHAIADIRKRVEALAGVPFALGPANNIPPGDPQAAVADLTESLNAYLFGVRDLQGLLRQEVVPRATFFQLADNYSRSVDRFKAARGKYDGTLQRNWPPELLPEWDGLRERLWAIHLVFFRLNEQDTTTIIRTERSPQAVRARMAALEPDLLRLQRDIEHFSKQLGTRRIDHAQSN